ncbi:hypothetical protein CLV47_10276 [Antricoccus suffuscus]|uniref:ATP synthase protein I n=1 Tax=Antricoccus suffuscus TaxID=1629062 RepID=A0A2T1A469_9ACTN|nr:ATP synthase subunit I [Antricoccus suffuscus]PRZ43390.1 hypothetical protein CLV47_10276 [Antricoccus suffuscus]
MQIPRYPPKPVRPDVPWSLAHLKVGFIASLVLLIVGAPLAWAIRGWQGAFGVLVGLVIVTIFFAFGSWAVVKAGKYDDRLTLPAALGSYLIKIGILAIVLVSIPLDGPVDVGAMAITVLVGTLMWAGVQIKYVLSKQIFYVDYTPPAHVVDESAAPSADIDEPVKKK